MCTLSNTWFACRSTSGPTGSSCNGLSPGLRTQNGGTGSHDGLAATASVSSEANKATNLRKREVVLSRISIYIVFVFLLCHSVRIIPNGYEMFTTYIKVSLRSRQNSAR